MSGSYSGLGLLVPAGIVPPAKDLPGGKAYLSDQGRVFYCPCPVRDYNKYDDYWWWCKPDAAQTTRMNYSMRPQFMGVSGSNALPYASHVWVPPAFGTPKRTVMPATTPPKVYFPRTKDFKNVAIVADLVDAPQHLRDQHRDGWNVLYSNYAVKYIRAEYVRSATPGVANTSEWEAVTDAGASTTANRPPLCRVWLHFDRL
jgi:hypothetical protein